MSVPDTKNLGLAISHLTNEEHCEKRENLVNAVKIMTMIFIKGWPVLSADGTFRFRAGK